jgi:hypothetical protein
MADSFRELGQSLVVLDIDYIASPVTRSVHPMNNRGIAVQAVQFANTRFDPLRNGEASCTSFDVQ